MVKKKTSIKISNIALIVVLILIFAYFLLYGIRDVTVCNNIKTDELKEYQGNVELKTENRTRNTVYFIKLDNGDTVRVNPDLLESGADLEQYEQLSIRYSEPKYGLKGAYTAVEIRAGDNDTILLDDQASKLRRSKRWSIYWLYLFERDCAYLNWRECRNCNDTKEQ